MLRKEGRGTLVGSSWGSKVRGQLGVRAIRGGLLGDAVICWAQKDE